jgi:hypothetical protein
MDLVNFGLPESYLILIFWNETRKTYARLDELSEFVERVREGIK